MKGRFLIPVYLLSLVLSAQMVLPVSSRVEVDAAVNREKVRVSFEISGLNSTIFEEMVKEELITNQTIPEAIKSQRKLQISYEGTVEFKNETNSVFAKYSFWGSDLLSRSIEGSVEKYRLRTDWRKFKLNLTRDFSVNFAGLFGAPVKEWNRTGLEYYYTSHAPNGLGKVCFHLKLPSWASDVHVATDGETILFERTFSLEERFINSPFLVLAALAVVYLFVLVYRKVKP